MKNNYLLHFGLLVAMFLLPAAGWGETTKTLNISQGSITITSTGYTVGSVGENSFTGGYVITGTTTSNTVTVASGKHDITLDGVNIDVSGNENAGAFAIAANAQVNLTLTGENVLKSSPGRAGLGVPKNATLIIMKGSPGSLDVTAGTDGAGIGGDRNNSAGIITINGGAIIASGNGNGAGIGSGHNAGGGPNGGDITINGGMVTANAGAGRWASSIGGGAACPGKNITITGGTVFANQNIGGGGWNENPRSGGNIIMQGGKVTARSIGGGSSVFSGSASANFSTGNNGNAFILINERFSVDTDNESEWSCVLFKSNTGKVYGNPTLSADLEIPAGKKLDIESGHTLTVGHGTELTNSGTVSIAEGATLQNNGTIIDKGTLTNKGTFNGNKVTTSLKLSESSGSTTYQGDDLTFTYTYNGDGEVTVASGNGSVATVSVSQNTVTVKPVSAGNATITVSAAMGSLYAAISQTYSVTVEKATLTKDNFTFAALTGLVYTGSSLNVSPTVTTKLSTGTITEKYYKDGNQVAQVVDAGTYTVKIDVAGNGNYNEATGITGDNREAWTFTVAKATLTKDNFAFAAPTGLVYTGSSLNVSPTVTTKLSTGTITEKYYKDGNQVAQVVDAGTYTVKIDVAGNGNCNEATGITGEDGSTWTFTVGPKIFTVTPKENQVLFAGWTGSDIAYEKDVQDVTLSGALSVEEDGERGTYKIIQGSLALGETDANNYTLKFTEDVAITVYAIAATEVEATATNGLNPSGWANGTLTLKAPDGFVFTDEDGYSSESGTKEFTSEGNYYLKQTGSADVYLHLLPIDKTAPFAPAAPDESSVTTTTATFTLTDALSGIAAYTVLENGQGIAAWPVKRAAAPGELSLVYTYTGTPGSVHTLDIEVTDMAGNTATSSVTFALKNNPYIPPVSSYYDIYLESGDSVRLSSGSTVVEEGYSFTFTAEVTAGFDPATLVVEYKRGRSGEWRVLEAESNGKYRVQSVYDDIYVRAAVRRIEDPTALESITGETSRIRVVGSCIRIGAARPVSMRIVSLGGYLVRSEQLPAGDSEISGLQQGVYVVLLSDGTRTKVIIR